MRAVPEVSGVWLLGLSDLPDRTADLLAASLQMSEVPRALTLHFDGLVREAAVSARDWPRHIHALSESGG